MSSDYEKAFDNYRYYQYCREQGHDQFLRNAELALAYFVGRHWTDEELSDMRATGRPALTVNQLFRNIDSIVGEMIYATGDVRFSPTDTRGGDDVSDVLDKTYVNINQQNKIQYQDPKLLLMGMLTGRAYYDVRVDFDEQMQGNVQLRYKRPQNVVLNPFIETPDPDDWPEVFETSMVNLDDIALSYGDAAAEEISNIPQTDWLSPYDQANERLLSQRMNGNLYFTDSSGLVNMGDPRLLKIRRLIQRQYRVLKYKEHFVDPQTGEMSQIPDNWDRNRIARVREMTGVEVIKKRTKVIRWLVTCDRFVLHDDESPYRHFTIVPFFPYFVDGYPMSLGEQLVDMQRMTNKLYSQVLHILNSAANSGWKVKSGSLKNMTMEELETKGAQTGLVAELDDVNNLERIQPGQLPTGHDSLAQTLGTMFKEISGYTTTMQGADRADASAKSIDSKLARGQVNLASAYKSLYHTKTMVAERVCNLVQNYYTETRLLHVTHGIDDQRSTMVINQPTPEGRVLNDVTNGKYDVTIIPAPSRETVMQSVFQQLYDMRKDLGIQIPDDVLIQYSALPEKTDVLQAIKANTDPNAAARQQQMAEAEQQANINSKNAAASNAQSQGKLAEARAVKAIADANSNPQADRLALDRERLSIEQQRDARQAAQQREDSDRDTALKVTDMHLTHRHDMAKLAQDHQDSNRDTVLQATQMHLDHQVKKDQAKAAPKKSAKPKTPTTPRGKGA